ncbi:hypothetical protein MMC25_000364 [Agyrium rufum]|nr:hypothetical protein [Agyrium rufum]
MGDKAQVNRSLNSIHTELEYLRDSGVLSPPQFSSILAQLPQHNGAPSTYVDLRYAQFPQGPPPGYAQFPSAIAAAAQDPNHPANPQNPQHHEWAKTLGSKFGNALVWGAGATAGADMVNDVFKHI